MEQAAVSTHRRPKITALARSDVARQIGRVPSRSVPRAPYSLAPTDFPLPALAAMAGRAPLGGPRELALACFVVCRMVDVAAWSALTLEQRKSRAQGTRTWLGSAAIPAPARTALAKLADALVTREPAPVSDALGAVIAVTASRLDPGARLELGRLAQGIAE